MWKMYVSMARRALTTPAISTTRRAPTASVFLNMGGPANQSEVEDFLFRLFSDTDIIPLGRFQPLLASSIVKLRASKIKKQYAAIGGGSPIRKWSELQAAETCRILDTISPSSAPHHPYVAFRYAHPLTEEVYAKLLADGFGERGRVIAFSQYPHFSCGTTGSSVNELNRCREQLDREGKIRWSIIDRWPAHDKFTKAIAQNIRNQLEAFPESERGHVTIVFSAHSQPVSAMSKGDPYSAEIAATMYSVMQHLQFSNPYRLSWQSKVGLIPWLEPQTSHLFQSYIKKGDPNIIIVPLAFTSDHIETLFELDEELIGESGHALTVRRAESLNGNPLFIEALAEIVQTHILSGQTSSNQFQVRCLGCKKDSCRGGRNMFTA